MLVNRQKLAPWWMGLFCIMLSGQAAAEWYGPQPFRQDRLNGRSLEYNAESFLHRFSFEPKPAIGIDARAREEGLYVAAGSTRSNELYVNMRAHAELDMDGPAFAEYRFRRFEDLDGIYDSNLVGVGAAFGDWRASVLGDVVATKEDVDLHYELQWANGRGSRLRAVLVQVDPLYNTKQGEGAYERYPVTAYLEGAWRTPGNVTVYGFLNANLPTRLRNAAEQFRLRDRQYSAGLGFDMPLSRNWELALELEGLTGLRRREGHDGLSAEDQHLRRRSAVGTLELRQFVRDDLSAWYGVRHRYLDERDRRPEAPDAWHRSTRRETMVYAGVRWQWRPRVAFRPGVFLNVVDNQARYPFDPGNSDEASGFYGKLAPAVEFLVNRRTGGTITVNPTLRLHRAAFGGGNIQASFPF